MSIFFRIIALLFSINTSVSCLAGFFDYQKIPWGKSFLLVDRSETDTNGSKRLLVLRKCVASQCEEDDPCILIAVTSELPPDFILGTKSTSSPYEFSGGLKALYTRPEWKNDGTAKEAMYLFKHGCERGMEALGPIMLLARLVFQPELDREFLLPTKQSKKNNLQFEIIGDDTFTWSHLKEKIVIQVEIIRAEEVYDVFYVKEIIFTLIKIDQGLRVVYALEDVDPNACFISDELKEKLFVSLRRK